MGARVLLLTVPIDNPVYMPTGLGYISGYILERLGADVTVLQRDLNTDYFEWAAGRPLVDAMRSMESYRDFEAHLSAREAISSRVRAASSGEIDISRNSVFYLPHEDYKSRAGILAAVEHADTNVLFPFFDQVALPYILASRADIIGISVKDQKQYLSAFLLAATVKQRMSGARIVLGGNMITRNYDVHCRDDSENRALHEYVDAIIHHEGEIAFTEYVRATVGGGSLSNVPKLIYREGGRIRENLEFPVVPMQCIPPPDYTGFVAQGNHWAPAPVIPYVMARGCYWGHCSFCDIPIGYDSSQELMGRTTGKRFKIDQPLPQSRREPGFSKALADLRFLSHKYRSRWFGFGDEELDAKALAGFAERPDTKEFPLEFEAYSRIEPRYIADGDEFCSRAYKSGVRFLQFGLESVSMRVLAENQKYSPSQATDISGAVFSRTYAAGIMNHAFILIGLPGDSLIEACRTIPYLEGNAQHLTTIKPVFHKVSKWSPIALEPAKYGIVLDREATGDLDVNLKLGAGSTVMSRHRAEAFVRFLDLWIRKHHRVNVATSQYIYAQRLFLGRDMLEQIAAEHDQPTTIDSHDQKHLSKLHAGLLDELKTAAYGPSDLARETRQAYSALYIEGRASSASDFDSILALVKRVAEVPTPGSPGAGRD